MIKWKTIFKERNFMPAETITKLNVPLYFKRAHVKQIADISVRYFDSLVNRGLIKPSIIDGNKLYSTMDMYKLLESRKVD